MKNRCWPFFFSFLCNARRFIQSVIRRVERDGARQVHCANAKARVNQCVNLRKRLRAPSKTIRVAERGRKRKIALLRVMHDDTRAPRSPFRLRNRRVDEYLCKTRNYRCRLRGFPRVFATASLSRRKREREGITKMILCLMKDLDNDASDNEGIFSDKSDTMNHSELQSYLKSIFPLNFIYM